jgi:hypothetical protein
MGMPQLDLSYQLYGGESQNIKHAENISKTSNLWEFTTHQIHSFYGKNSNRFTICVSAWFFLNKAQICGGYEIVLFSDPGFTDSQDKCDTFLR